MNFDEWQRMKSDDLRGLTDLQQQLLVFLPIPSALLSLAGSYLIIFMAMRSHQRKKYTPYSRLLVVMSLYDIQSSITYAMAPFLRPYETSTRLYAHGDETTCTTVAFLNQLSMSALFYNGMLSFYFLLATRFRYTNEQLSRVVEPLMHVTAIGYPLVTAIAGLVFGWYGEVNNGLSCWVGHFPNNCGDEAGQTGETCTFVLVMWLFYAIPSFITLASLTINGIVIFCFVINHMSEPIIKPLSKQNNDATKISRINGNFSKNELLDENDEEYGYDHDASGNDAQSFDNDYNVSNTQDAQKVHARTVKQQNRRLTMLGSQAILYIVTFVTCNVGTVILLQLESKARTETEDKEMQIRFYPIFVMQAIFHPLQGCFNMLVFIRPKYLKYRYQYSNKKRMTVAKMAIFGSDSSSNDGVKTPTAHRPPWKQQASKSHIVTRKENQKSPEKKSFGQKSVELKDDQIRSSRQPLPRGMMSSLTLSLDEYEVPLEEGKEWVDFSKKVVKKKKASAHRYFRSLRPSELEMISELSESIFEPIVADDEPLVILEVSVSPNQAPESRWGSNKQRLSSDLSPSLAMKVSLDLSHRSGQTEEEGDIDISERRWESRIRRRPSDPSLKSLDRRISSDTSSSQTPTSGSPTNRSSLCTSVRTPTISNGESTEEEFFTDLPIRKPTRMLSSSSLSSNSMVSSVDMVSSDDRNSIYIDGDESSVDAPMASPQRRLSDA